jgi:MOSC domain-containing protein YiiM
MSGKGEVVGIFVAPAAGAAMTELAEATAVAGAGIEGDRYRDGIGFYSPTPGPRQLTLIEEETLEALLAEHGIELPPHATRRNLVTRGIRLNDLVGQRFTIGEVVCTGVRLCPPCNRLEELTGKPVLGPLVNRGGLRADILMGGVIRRGDAIEEADSLPNESDRRSSVAAG